MNWIINALLRYLIWGSVKWQDDFFDPVTPPSMPTDTLSSLPMDTSAFAPYAGSGGGGGGGEGGIWSALSKYLPWGLMGGGFLANFLQNQQRNKIINAMTNPNQLAARVAAAEQPLSTGLTQGVGNQVQAFLAERGLGQSPTVAAEVETQALAPYKLAQQQAAIQEVLQAMGIASGSLPKGGIDLSSLIKAMLIMNQQKRGGAQPATSATSAAPASSAGWSPGTYPGGFPTTGPEAESSSLPFDPSSLIDYFGAGFGSGADMNAP